MLVTLLVTLRAGQMAAKQAYTSPGAGQTNADVVIPTGGGSATAEALAKAGVIRHPLVFRAAAWLTRTDGVLHAGEFIFPAHASIREILNILRHGKPVEHQVTIPEGLTGAQIAKIINNAPTATGEVTAPPDGSVLPQTYNYPWGTPRAAILARAEAAMQASLDTAWPNRAQNVPLNSPQEAVILASIVQQETPLGHELPQVAAVYENRLRQGMKLQADPTVIYAATGGKQSGGTGISRTDLANPSPYNTYAHAGLPPGPICAPGAAAIDAVLHPANSDALYFVATGNGGHVFSRLFKDQLRNIEHLFDARR
ncbi:endolytic transglycosylase MltG [Acidocella aromatica]|uniref:Endolytic murein transglycosylase n=1 Tax=Acidocella aromatica TaxID=1303579 RepID=A0A840VK78_9PROT|nr:endolytic transglycosylase MltG [Acidocella aromatica]MBB5373575.1 UPF0755 protein [Acidocella aromatica]